MGSAGGAARAPPSPIYTKTFPVFASVQMAPGAADTL